jgi:hypothetical protein
MATFNKFNSFVQALAHKEHDLESDQLIVFLTNTAPTAANTQLSDITQITYTNLSSRNITTASSGQTSGQYNLVLTDLTLTASGSVGPFRYVGVYNETSTGDLLVGWYDYGSSITMATGETFDVNFDAFTVRIQ